MVAGLLEPQLGPRRWRRSAEDGELRICAAALHQRVWGPRRAADQVEWLDLHRGRQREGRHLRCRLPAVGRSLRVSEYAARVLADARRWRLRPDGAVLQDVSGE